jgi:hypothetical protein
MNRLAVAPRTPRTFLLSLCFLALAGVLSVSGPRTATANGEVGTVAPDFTLNNVLSGPTTVTLSQYAGSVVVIAFFAEW